MAAEDSPARRARDRGREARTEAGEARTETRTPRIEIIARIEITGEWVNPGMVALAAQRLADDLAGKLRASAEEGFAAQAERAEWAHGGD